MDESSRKSEFRVVDKRRFNAEGDDRGAEADVEREESAARPERPVAEGAGAKGASVKSEANRAAAGSAGGASEGRRTTVEKAAEPRDADQDTIDFSSFVVSMGTQALMALGEMPHPETRTATVNLDAAKQMIDILGLLEAKTKGNLSAEEVKLLQEILSSLRMLFARKVR